METFGNINHDQSSETKGQPRKLHPVLSNIGNHIFDFFMLFLAVFCGFMADNWREQLSEHQREKTYVLSIYEDIKSDTLESGKIIAKLRSIHTGIEQVLTALKTTEVLENSNDVYNLWTRNIGLYVFVSNDRTIQQLKNSGDLRLIRNKKVSDKIMEYDLSLKKYKTQSDMMYNALTNVTYYSQLFDFINLKKHPETPVPLTDLGKKTINQAYANLDLWDRALTGLISWLETVRREGNNSLECISREYRLEPEAE